MSNYCINCKHCKIISYDEAGFGHAVCKANYLIFDYVQGHKDYFDCDKINTCGQCKQFKPNIIFKIKNIIKKNLNERNKL